MENTEMKKIIDRQRAFFHTGTTLDVSFRIAALKRLQYMIRRHEKEIEAALLLDLKKSSFESYMCETGLVLDEIHYMLRQNTAGTVLLQKLPETFSLRCHADRKSLELSDPADS